MRFGTDASHLAWRRTGTARYIDGLTRALAAAAGGDEVVAYYNATRRARLLPEPVVERFIRLPSHRATAWTQLRLWRAVRRDRCDAVLGHHVLPVLPGPPAVLVLYDLLAFRDPAAKPGAEGAYYRRWMPRSAARASRLVAISRFTAAEAERWLHVDASRIAIASPGVDAAFFEAGEDERAAARTALRSAGVGEADAVVLQVGAGEPHKGAEVAEAAVAALAARGRGVVLARCGGRRAGAPGSGGRCVDLGWVDDAVLRGLYATAAAVCVASTHEGFGLPALEAMAAGTPVVASDAAALREAGGELARYVPPGDPAALAAALEGVLDSTGGERERSAARAWASRFTWAASAEVVLDALRDSAPAATPRRGDSVAAS
ncbi:MAG TPA: glycosyltransferase family 1 protein [Candidatus Dormibacteraeota bacterium]|nr:glycosyltransferase family 1 protein [Candidatus Dormibacteraeota bacterium]